jgi:hypothetical protein
MELLGECYWIPWNGDVCTCCHIKNACDMSPILEPQFEEKHITNEVVDGSQ